MARFELIADDGFGASVPATITVKVSDAPLIALDFVERNSKLQIGERTQLVAIGDFADQEDVILPSDYLTWKSENGEVASVSLAGLVTGLSDGTTILSAQRNGIGAVTVSRVGKLAISPNEAEVNIALAEDYGLNVYPRRITLTSGITRQLLVGLTDNFEGANLANSLSRTRYFVSNPSVLTVSPDGLITTLDEGIANVTIVYGVAEEVVPVTGQTHLIFIKKTHKEFEALKIVQD
jgi:hypothetical protein